MSLLPPILFASSSSEDDTPGTLSDGLSQARDKLVDLKRDLAHETELLEEAIASTHEYRPRGWPALLVPAALSVDILRGNIQTPVNLVSTIGFFLAVTVGVNVLARKKLQRSLAQKAVAIERAGSLVSALGDILQQHKQYVASLRSLVNSGQMSAHDYDNKQAVASSRFVQLATEAFDTHTDLFDILTPVQREYVLSPSLTSSARQKIFDQVRQADSLAGLATLQAPLLADPSLVADPRIRDVLDAIETRSSSDLAAAVSLSVATPAERHFLMSSLRKTPALHANLATALSHPGIAKSIAGLDEIKKSVMFATGDRISAWRKLIHTTTLDLSLLPVYASVIEDDASLRPSEKAALACEFRARVEGTLAAVTAVNIASSFSGLRLTRFGSMDIDKGTRKRLFRPGVLASFDVVYRQAESSRADIDVEEVKAKILDQIGFWSRPRETGVSEAL